MSRLKDLKNLYLIETEINESLETLCNELNEDKERHKSWKEGEEAKKS